MIKPATRHCDLCTNEINRGKAFASLNYPLDRSDAELIRAEGMSPAPPSIFGLAMQMPMPSHYQFEICRPCVDGLLPMLDELKRKYLEQHAIERRRQLEAAQVSDDSDRD